MLGWRKLHHALIPLVGVMYTALLNWREPKYDDDEVCIAGEAKDDLCHGGEKLHCGTMSSVGRSDAASGDQWAEGKCRLGYVIGFMVSTLTGPYYILQWAPKCSRKLAKSGLGGGVYAGSYVSAGRLFRTVCGLGARNGGIGGPRKFVYQPDEKVSDP